MKYALDVESVGLKGDLMFVQLCSEDGKIEIIDARDNTRMGYLRMLLNKEDHVFYIWNMTFDLWKLYQFFQPEVIFRAKFIDLYLHFGKANPYKHLSLFGGKGVVSLRRIPAQVCDEVLASVAEDLQKIMPSFVRVKVVKSPKKNGMNDLTFRLTSNLKLKDVIEALGLDSKPLRIEDAYPVPKTLGWKEDNNPVIKEGGSLEDDKMSRVHYDHLKQYIYDKMSTPEWQTAVKYMEKDVEYLWLILKHLESFGNSIEENNDDVCAHAVAWTKYKGFTVDLELLGKKKEEIEKLLEKASTFPFNIESPKQRLEFFRGKFTIEGEEIPLVNFDKHRIRMLLREEAVEMSVETREMLEYIENYKSLKQAYSQILFFEASATKEGRVYPEFRVIGTSTNRMSGTGGLNFQGVSRDSSMRDLVKISMGGDFSSLEVNIAAYVFEDKNLIYELENGLDFHTRTASLLFDDLKHRGYEEWMEISKDVNHPDYGLLKKWRTKAKGINFALLYFAGAFTIAQQLEISEEEAQELMDSRYYKHYPSFKETQEILKNLFCTIHASGGDNRAIQWQDVSLGSKMGTQVQDLFGNLRYCTFEKLLVQYLWEHSRRISDKFKNIEGTVIRNENKGAQKIHRAVLSAFLGAAITAQKKVMKQMGNFMIQSSGSNLTKGLMATLFKEFGCPVMNIHDELIIPDYFELDFSKVDTSVKKYLEDKRALIPTLGMDFKECQTWKDK